MSRSDQYIGMTEAATKFLQENEVVEEPCPHCQRPYPVIRKEIATYSGMFGEDYSLYRHELKDGRTADEFLQAEPWSSGPMFFIGLKVSDGTEFLWPDKEIDTMT